MLTKKFKSTSGKPERVVNENLDVAMVGVDWTVLPFRFHKAAYAAGCESEDMAATNTASTMSESEQKILNTVFNEKHEIRNAILQLMKNGDEKDFTFYKRSKEWKVSVASLNKILGRQISNAQRDMHWYKLLEEDQINIPDFK